MEHLRSDVLIIPCGPIKVRISETILNLACACFGMWTSTERQIFSIKVDGQNVSMCIVINLCIAKDA